MFGSAAQLIAHGIGDYILQSDYMALQKTKSKWAALAHVLTYTIPFLFITHAPLALFVIASTHFAIDHWRLARYVVWAKNFIGPRWIDDPNQPGMKLRNYPWAECVGTGYHASRPDFLAVWLLIFADNLIHVTINAAAILYLG
jgi:hypothetical protein